MKITINKEKLFIAGIHIVLDLFNFAIFLVFVYFCFKYIWMKLFVKFHAKSLDLELTLFYLCHEKNKNKKNQNPRPKSIRRGCTTRLKLDAQDIHGLLNEFRGLRVHVTRRTRTTRRTKARAKVLQKLEFDTKGQVLFTQ